MLRGLEKDAVCVAQPGHQQVPLCPAFSRSFLHLLSTLTPLPRHFLFLLPVHLFSFYHSLALSSYPLLSHYVIPLSFFLFPPSFTLLPPLFFCISSFFCYSCAVSLPLSLKKSPPRISTCECLYLELSSPHFYVCSPRDAHTDTVYSLVHIN